VTILILIWKYFMLITSLNEWKYRILLNYLLKLNSYLEYSAYPVISPHNSTFPENFTPGRLTKTFLTRQIGGSNQNKQDVYMNITSPYAGYWFSAAFIDSNDQKVKPDLLRSNCSFYLTPSVNLWQINDSWVLYPNQTVFSSAHSVYRIFK